MKANVRLVALVAAAWIVCVPAQAQDYPSRPVEVIVGFTAGGSSDVVARRLAEIFEEELKGPFVIQNRPGASATVALNAVARAQANGYTLSYGPTTPIVQAPHMMKSINYGIDDFDYICMVFKNVFTVAVRANSPFKTFDDLKKAMQSGARLTYGHSGPGTVGHLAGEHLFDALGVKAVNVPYQGAAAFNAALISGELDFAVTAFASVVGQDLRFLVVFDEERNSAYPKVPTAKELIGARTVPPGYNGLIGPKGLPAEIKARLEAACQKATKDPRLVAAVGDAKEGIGFLSGKDFEALTRDDYELKGALMKRLKLVN